MKKSKRVESLKLTRSLEVEIYKRRVFHHRNARFKYYVILTWPNGQKTRIVCPRRAAIQMGAKGLREIANCASERPSAADLEE